MGLCGCIPRARIRKKWATRSSRPCRRLPTGQPLDLIQLDPRQHFTEPPPRYTEATIVKALEERGIGRPSTYASIISVIRDRKYVDLTDKRFYPTELGFKVTDQLVKHFPTVMDVKFTADMETKLDEVEEGRVDWVSLLRNFYDPFELSVNAAKEEMENLKPQPVETEYHCPDTGKVMLLRQGRFGEFMGCSGYPECKKILKLDAEGKPAEGANFLCGLVSGGTKRLLIRPRCPMPQNTSARSIWASCCRGRGVSGRFWAAVPIRSAAPC